MASADPIYSFVRFSLDFSHTTAAGNVIVGNDSVFPSENLKPTAFGYGIRDSNMKAGGFGTTKPTERYTNLVEAGRLPFGEEMAVQSIALVPMGHLTKPASVASADARVLDEHGDQLLVNDAVAGASGGQLYSLSLELIDRCFSVALIQGPPGASGKTTRLPSISMLSAGRGFAGMNKQALMGSAYQLGKPVVWRKEGADQFLRIEFENKRKFKAAAWTNTAAAANTALISNLATLASLDNGAAHDAGEGAVNLDFAVVLFGIRSK